MRLQDTVSPKIELNYILKMPTKDQKKPSIMEKNLKTTSISLTTQYI